MPPSRPSRLLLSAVTLAVGCGAPRARVAVTRLGESGGTGAGMALLRCVVSRLPAARVRWVLEPGVRPLPGQPIPGVVTERTGLLVHLPSSPAQAGAACEAVDESGALRATAAARLVPPLLARATQAGRVITVEGEGFGERPSPGDGLWLEAAGRLHPVALDCPEAVFGPRRVAGCAPEGAQGASVRLALGGALVARTLERSEAR